jgi:hypothetical protein
MKRVEMTKKASTMREENIDRWFHLSELNRELPRPIFIVGSPRSGTTLMRSLIDAHPSIFCPPCETFLFTNLNATFNGHIWKDHYEQLPFSRSALIQWFRNYVLELFANLSLRAGKMRWAEKTPSHVLFLQFIDEVFPDSQVIHMIRNGYDVVRSLKNIHWAPRDVRVNSREWIRHVKGGQRYGKQLSENRYIEVRFEKLLNDPEAVLKRLCIFLGEPYDPKMLDFHKPENNSWGIRLSPLKKKVETGKNKDLSLFERYRFKKLAGDLMKELGYDI